MKKKQEVRILMPIEAELNTSTLLRQFQNLYKERLRVEFHMNGINRTVLNAKLKKGVIDYFLINDLTVADMNEFLIWVFRNKTMDKWVPSMLPFFTTDWAHHRAVAGAKVSKKVETNRQEEEQFVHYLKENFFNNELTKMQF